MQICLTSHNQEQHKLDFSTALYQSMTISLARRQITVNFLIGLIYDRSTENQSLIVTIEIVNKFKTYQERQDLSKNTIDTYHPVLVALADFAPEWPPTPEAIDSFLDGYKERGCSGVTLAEYWGRINTWFKWAQKKGHIDINPMIKVDRRKMPIVEAGVIRPQDFVKVIKFLKGVVNNSRPKQHTLPYERAIRDLAIIRFAYATGCRRGEVAGLRMRDLYLADNKAIIQLKTSKTKRNRPDVFLASKLGWP